MQTTQQQIHSTIYPIALAIQLFLAAYRQRYHPSLRQVMVLEKIARCRTAFFGGQQVSCSNCGFSKTVYHSCGDRNCPTCQSIKKEMWIDKRKAQLLDVPHFHVIFTVPHQLNELFLHAPTKMYGLLFSSCWKSVQYFTREQHGKDAQTGMLSSLHTWGSNLSLHPHLHCIVPGGALDGAGDWQSSPHRGGFLVNGRKLAARFKSFFRCRAHRIMGKR